jgi:choline dehydrogenase
VRADPAIQFNFFEHEVDHRAAIEGLRWGRRISQTQPMADCVKREISPGLDVTSDDEMIAYCRQNGLSLLHPVGTCAMGTGTDAVVDTDLRVHGLSGLRVIDASIMPRIVTANTNAAAIMIGEKGAAHILRDLNR